MTFRGPHTRIHCYTTAGKSVLQIHREFDTDKVYAACTQYAGIATVYTCYGSCASRRCCSSAITAVCLVTTVNVQTPAVKIVQQQLLRRSFRQNCWKQGGHHRFPQATAANVNNVNNADLSMSRIIIVRSWTRGWR